MGGGGRELEADSSSPEEDSSETFRTLFAPLRKTFVKELSAALSATTVGEVRGERRGGGKVKTAGAADEDELMSAGEDTFDVSAVI